MAEGQASFSSRSAYQGHQQRIGARCTADGVLNADIFTQAAFKGLHLGPHNVFTMIQDSRNFGLDLFPNAILLGC